MPLLYYDNRPESNEPGNKIIPAPKASISRQDLMGEDGIVVGRTYQITLTGKLLPKKGSPSFDPATGECSFWQQSDYPPDYAVLNEQALTALLAKQKALRKLFSINGKCLEIYGYEESAPFFYCYPRVKNIDIKEGATTSWVTECDYTIQLEADTIYFTAGAGEYGEESVGNLNSPENADIRNYRIAKSDESWQIDNMEESDQKAFKIVHNISVVGKKSYDVVLAIDGTPFYKKEAWQNGWDYAKAKLFVQNTSAELPNGINDFLLENVPVIQNAANPDINTSPYLNYNYVRTFNINKTAASISITENLIKARAVAVKKLYDLIVTPACHALEKCDIQISEDEQHQIKAEINGKITGLEDFKIENNQIIITKPKLQNAQQYFDTYVNPANSTSLIKERLDAWLENYSAVQNWMKQISSVPVSRTISINLEKGIIDYRFSYTANPNAPAGFKNWDVNISDDYAVPHIASIPVLGRSLGPLIYYLGTKTAYKRSLRIQGELAEAPVSNPSPFQQLSPYKPGIESYICSCVPIGSVVVRERDSESWNPQKLTYSRDISWIYER